MIERVLVPLDGSELSDGILRHVKRLLLTDRPEVVLVTVIPERATTAEIFAADTHLEKWSRLLEAEGVRVRARIERGEPAAKILEVAREVGPALVALSSHGRTGVMRWVRGSVAERLLERSPTPLLLASPAGLESSHGTGFRRILVPLDGSPASAAVLPLVHDLARTFDSEVVLLHVLEMTPAVALGEPLAAIPEVGEARRAEADRMLERSARDLGGVSVRCRVLWGGPATTILDTATAEGAALLAMTTHGRSGLSRWLYGSIAGLVLRHARTPLLVVRPEQGAE